MAAGQLLRLTQGSGQPPFSGSSNACKNGAMTSCFDSPGAPVVLLPSIVVNKQDTGHSAVTLHRATMRGQLDGRGVRLEKQRSRGSEEEKNPCEWCHQY